MFGPIDVMVIRATPEMIHHWGWFLAFGIVLLLLGIAAVVRSVAATVASMVFFGWLLVFASVVQFCECVPGWELGRVLPAHADRDSLRNNRRTDARETGDKRRSCDFADVDVL